MQTQDQIKEMVKQKYSEIALQDKTDNAASCCGADGCSTEVYNIMTDDYNGMQGYTPDADLGLGCGLPTQFAKIKKGDVVIDLGSGAIQKQAYLALIQQNGFENITIQKEKPILVPDDILLHYLSPDELAQFRNSQTGIYSITVFAQKPEGSKACCGSDCCS